MVTKQAVSRWENGGTVPNTETLKLLSKELNVTINTLPLPSGASVKFLNDQTTYLGNQLESEIGGDRCFDIPANIDFIVACTYEAEDANPELLLYNKR